MLFPRRFPVAVVLVIVAITAFVSTADAQKQLGIVDEFFSVDPEKPVDASKYPTISLEDLRRITRYSNLQMTKKGALFVDDSEHLRGVEPLTKDPDVVRVSGDHFSFTTLRSGQLRGGRLSKASEGDHAYLWIKYESKEQLAGRPQLKDLVLVPFSVKSGKLAESQFLNLLLGKTEPTTFIAYAGSTTRLQEESPEARDSVVGVLPATKSVHFLVFSIFGDYQWIGRVGGLEYLAARTSGDLDAFHAKPKRKKDRSWVAKELRMPAGKSKLIYGARDAAGLESIQKRLPHLLEIESGSVDREGFESLLRLEYKNEPMKSVDAIVGERKNLGELLQWVDVFLSSQKAHGSLDWSLPLDQRRLDESLSRVLQARVLRYAFRSHGFPARIVGLTRPRYPHSPQLLIEIYLPGHGVSWVIRLARQPIHAVAEVKTGSLARLEWHKTVSAADSVPFELPLGGEDFFGRLGP